jgi:hypothetical protein
MTKARDRTARDSLTKRCLRARRAGKAKSPQRGAAVLLLLPTPTSPDRHRPRRAAVPLGFRRPDPTRPTPHSTMPPSGPPSCYCTRWWCPGGGGRRSRTTCTHRCILIQATPLSSAARSLALANPATLRTTLCARRHRSL